MALAAMLSAMRTLILDAPPLPDNQPERAAALRGMFPSLDAPEIEDLSRMQPARLQIYTRSIFNAEAELLSHYHPIACALLGRSMELQGSPFKIRAFVQSAHGCHPWMTATTEGLIEAFGRALSDPRIDVGPLRVEIADAARFERHLFYARRKPCGLYDPRQSLAFADFAELTVGRILDLRWGMPETVSCDIFGFDLGRVHNQFHRAGAALPAEIEKRDSRLVFSRDRTHAVRWREVGEAFYSYISLSRQGGTLARLAEAVLSDMPEDHSEEEGFRAFLDALRFSVEAGIVVVLNQESE